MIDNKNNTEHIIKEIKNNNKNMKKEDKILNTVNILIKMREMTIKTLNIEYFKLIIIKINDFNYFNLFNFICSFFNLI
jgi:hypothetical protein